MRKTHALFGALTLPCILITFKWSYFGGVAGQCTGMGQEHWVHSDIAHPWAEYDSAEN